MSQFCVADYGLSASDLQARYAPAGDSDASHPVFTQAIWREAVANEGTLEGYWSWVMDQLRQEEEELGRDNPFTQHLGACL